MFLEFPVHSTTMVLKLILIYCLKSKLIGNSSELNFTMYLEMFPLSKPLFFLPSNAGTT